MSGYTTNQEFPDSSRSGQRDLSEPQGFLVEPETRVREMVKSLLVGLAFALGGGIVGLLIFGFLVQRGWWDGPGGGMIVFPMVLIPAAGCGLYGFISSWKRIRPD